MGSYSMDLRKRIVDAYQAGEGSVRELAARFAVDPRSVSRYLARVRETGSVAPKEHGGGAPTKVDREVLRRLWEEQPDATEAELAARHLQQTGVAVHRSSIGRVLLLMGMTRKKRASTPPSKMKSRSSPSSEKSPL